VVRPVPAKLVPGLWLGSPAPAAAPADLP